MSGFSSPRSQPNIVGVDDAAVARNVIRAMRSSSNSSRRYKQNATWDDHIISDVNQFNRMVLDQREEVEKQNAKEHQINEALANYIPPKQPMPVLNSPKEQRFREAPIDRFGDESDSDDDEYTTGKGRPQQHDRAPIEMEDHSSRIKGATSSIKENNLSGPKAGFDWDSDNDDDPSEMAELMADFVAPSSNAHGKGNRGVKQPGKAQAYKGQSSLTSSSIKFGAGGVRGIQHQSRNREAAGDVQQGEGDELDSLGSALMNTSISSTTIGVSGSASVGSTVTASRLAHIKPGQAIRVKAPSKRSRAAAQTHELGGGGGFIG